MSAHPGLKVRQHMKDEGLTVTAAAELLGVRRPTLSNMLNGNAAISPLMALRLERQGWRLAEYWVQEQASYDLAVERATQAWGEI